EHDGIPLVQHHLVAHPVEHVRAAERRSRRTLDLALVVGFQPLRRQVKLEASVFDAARRRMLNVAIDANDTIDPMGDKIQWATVSGGFNFQNPWLRSVRAGYRRNLVGSELSYISAGVSIFKWFDIDMALDLDRVEIKDDNYPRGFLVSFGAQVDF
ncbi:MAG: hypothetical protein ACWGPN_13995, partial [Gammaproteobacteria bacterium]